MAETESRIAQFLIDNDITIFPTSETEKRTLSFMQCSEGRVRDLGKIVYNSETGQTDTSPSYEVMKMFQLRGLRTEVVHPLVSLLCEEPDFMYASQYRPIRDACKSVETKFLKPD